MAADIFAKLGDIKGESQDAKHKDEIEVLSFSWGLANTSSAGSGSGSGAGKPAFNELSIVHKIDKASPSLMSACATGKHLPEAIITQRKAGKEQHEYLIIKMSDVLVSRVLSGGGDDAGSETVSFNFAKVQFEYRPQKADGTLDAAVHFKYDLRANKEG
jgi:type VI secretion system secreted protein Hcp